MLIQWYNWAQVIAVTEKKINVEMHKIIFHVKVTFKIVFCSEFNFIHLHSPTENAQNTLDEMMR